MLATLGIFISEKWHPLTDLDVPSYLLGPGPYIQQTSLANFWPAAIAALSLEETRWWIQNGKKRITGDYDWDPLGLKPTSPEAFKELQAKELNNGRLAMFAAGGILAQEMVTGHKLF